MARLRQSITQGATGLRGRLGRPPGSTPRVSAAASSGRRAGSAACRCLSRLASGWRTFRPVPLNPVGQACRTHSGRFRDVQDVRGELAQIFAHRGAAGAPKIRPVRVWRVIPPPIRVKSVGVLARLGRWRSIHKPLEARVAPDRGEGGVDLDHPGEKEFGILSTASSRSSAFSGSPTSR
jgi:hypothetical protein